MRTLTALFLSLCSLPALAGVAIQKPYWYVALQCSGYSACYASGNGGYTGSLAGAKRFDSPEQAQRFFETLTSSMEKKSPQIQQGSERLCLSDDEARRLNLSGPACQ